MRIVTIPDPILYKPTISITDIAMAKKLGVEMLHFMEASYGVGLAAPQVGLSYSLFVVSVTGRAEDGHIYINPEINLEDEQTIGNESCLSMPGVKLPILRHTKLAMKYTDISGKDTHLLASGVLARIIQHEYDHLQGILISDRFVTQNTIGNDAGTEIIK